MKSLPYFRWWVADAELDQNFRAMDDADIGFYIRCLNHAWINGGIPTDPKERARVLRTRLDTANKRWERVGKCFVNSTSAPGQLIDLRQESEREYASHKSLKAAESVNHRYERSTNEKRHARVSESDTESDTKTSTSSSADANYIPMRKMLEPIRAAIMDLPVPSQSEYPMVITEIRKHDPAVDDFFVLKLVQTCIQHCMSNPKFPEEKLHKLTDKVIASACKESFATGPPNHRAG